MHAVGIVFKLYRKCADGLLRFNKCAPNIMVADDAQFKRHLRLVGIADGGWHAAIGHRNDDICRHRTFKGQLAAKRLAAIINAFSANNTVGAGEINIFENAGARRKFGERFDTLQPIFGNDDNLAIFNLAHKLRADNIQRAGLRRQNIMPVKLAQNKRSNAQRVARANEFFIGHDNQRIRPFDLEKRIGKA